MNATRVVTSLEHESFPTAPSTKISQKNGIWRAAVLNRFCFLGLVAFAILSLPCRVFSIDCTCGVPVYIHVKNAGGTAWGGCSVGNPIYLCDANGNGGASVSGGGIGALGVGQEAVAVVYQAPYSTWNYTVRLPYNCGDVPAPTPPMHVVPVTTGCGPCYPPGVSYDVTLYIWPGGRGIYDNKNHSPKLAANGSGCGMPVWHVSEPYESLWLIDEPLGYQPAIGPRLSFALAYNQRDTDSGVDRNIFSVGRKWAFSLLSYVAKDVNANTVVYLPEGGSITFTNSTDFLTNTRLTGDTTNGFTLFHPDGSKNVYSFAVTNSSGGFLKAFMKEQWNAINQKTRFDYGSYTPADFPVIRLLDVVDGDGRTNYIYYATNNVYSTNLIAQVVDGFSRTAYLAYDSQGRITNITDVAGLSSGIGYDSSDDWATNLVTPYGTTGFKITDFWDGVVAPNGRSVEITEPDGSKQLYLYTNSAPGVASSYATNQIPNTYPYSNSFETNSLDVRNTFHWGPLQYSNLSTNFLLSGDLGQLQSGDYLKAHMKHWLLESSNTVSEVLSMERQPSPDGTTEGQKTWYDHAGKTNINYIGAQVLPLVVANVLPDGTTAFVRSDRNSLGNPTANASTYSIGANVYLRTNFYGYATNEIDLLTVTNALGIRVSSNYFNGYHQVLTNYNASNEMTFYSYNTNQQLASITRPNGLVTTNIYFTSGTSTNWLDRTMDFSGSTYFRTNAFTYGANGLLYSHTDERGLTITNYWDNLQRLTGRLYPDGTTTSNLYYRLDGQSYPNSSGGTNLLDLTATRDRITNWTYFAYDVMRRTIYETNAVGTVTAYGYCQCGALESATSALGKPEQLVTYHAHDNQGRRTSTIYPDTSGMTVAYDSLGRVTNVVTGLSSVTNYYNNQGLVTTSSNAFGRVFSATYDVLDRATNTVDANAITITSTYDNLGRPLTRGYPDGGQEKFVYTLNIAGVTSYTNQLGSNVVNYAYDALGRKTNEVNPAISTNSFAYDAGGSLTNLTDGKGQITRWNYDQYGRATNKVDATSTEIFRYQYDAGNRLTNRWTAAKGSTTYKYDQIGNLTNVLYPVSSALTMNYDALSRLTNMLDAVGTTSYGYANQFLASEDGPWDNDTISYTYANRLRSGLSLLQPNASSWTQSYGYDTANRLNTLSSHAGTFGYSYNVGQSVSPASLIGKLTLPNGAYITNTFDSVGRLLTTKLLNSSASVLNSHAYGYNLASQRTTLTNTAGNYVNYTYDLIGELKTATGKESGGSSRAHEQFGYAYDAAGNLNYRTNNALVQTFAANNLNELSSVTRSGTLTVAGGSSGATTNVTVNGSAASRYNDNTFALAGFTVTNGNNTFTAIAQDAYGRKDTNSTSFNLPSTVSFLYDSNGNLTSDGTRGFDYDDENQVTRVTVTNSWKSEFTYDGKFRRRVRKEFSWQNGSWVATSEVHYIYDGNVVIQERTALNVPQVTYTRTASRLLARSDMTDVTPIHIYFHIDGNANVTAMVNSQQIVVAKYVYDPFGNVLSKTGPLAEANTYRFSSQEYHQNSGLLLYLRRAYDPNLQRWLNRDPIAESGGINLYGYVRNNPVNDTDPFGLTNQPGDFGWSWYSIPVSGLTTANYNYFFPPLSLQLFNTTSINIPAILAQQELHDLIYPPVQGGPSATISAYVDPNSYNALMIGAPWAVVASPVGKEMAFNNAWDILTTPGVGIAGDWLSSLWKCPAGRKTVGDILAGHSSDTMIHLTTATEEELATATFPHFTPPHTTPGVLQGSSWVQLGDVSHMTLAEYQELVVGQPAAGYGNGVTAFVTHPPSSVFAPVNVPNLADVQEFINGAVVKPGAYVPLPGKP